MCRVNSHKANYRHSTVQIIIIIINWYNSPFSEFRSSLIRVLMLFASLLL
jgi:hypothetical protein